MDPATAILLAVIICGTGIGFKVKVKLDEKIDKVNEHCVSVSDKMIKVETKLDMLLHHSGFDVRKADKDIDEHMEDLKKNDKPKLGCINIDGLYRS